MFHFKILENLFRNSQVSSLELISHHNFPRGLPEKKTCLIIFITVQLCCLSSFRPQTEQPPTTNSGPSPSRTVHTTTTTASSSQTGTARHSQTAVGGAKPATLPANLDEFKVINSGPKNKLMRSLLHTVLWLILLGNSNQRSKFVLSKTAPNENIIDPAHSKIEL